MTPLDDMKKVAGRTWTTTEKNRKIWIEIEEEYVQNGQEMLTKERTRTEVR